MRRLMQRYGKYVIWAVVVAFLLGALVIFTPGKFNIARRGSPESREPALMVNGKKITKGEFNEQYNELLNRYRQLYSQNQLGSFDLQLQGASGAVYQLQLKQTIAQDLIRQTLLGQEAKERGISVSQAEYEAEAEKQVQEQFDYILDYYQLSEAELTERLAQEGRTVEDFKQDIRGEIDKHQEELRQGLREDKVRAAVIGAISPSEEDLQEYFEENKPQFASPEMVRARHILIKVAQDAPEEEVAAAQSRIEELQAKLDEGADFAELAQQYSEDEGSASKGGDLGWFQRGQMVKEFEETAFALEPGQVSDIIRSQYGFHIIKLEDRREAATFEEVKDKVRSAYLEDQKETRFDEWYEEVRQAAEIQIELPVLRAYMLEEKDKDKALAAYEELASEGEVSDVYIPYYIARIYEEKLKEVQDQKEELEEEEQPDEQELKKLEELSADYTKKVKDKLYETLDAAGGSAELFEKLIPYDDQNPNLHYRYGQFLQEQGQVADAVEQLERTLELKPDHAGALILHADIMLEQDDYAKAIDNYNEALQLVQGDERRTVQMKLGQAYMEKEEYALAEELFAEVLDADPENQQVLTLMGDLLFATGRFAEATSYYERALRVAVKPELQVKLGNAYLKAENLKEAGEIFDKVVQGGSFYAAEAYLGRGDVHRAQGLREKALTDYKEGFKRSQYRTELREKLGEGILELDPEDIDTRFDLAKTYQSARNYDKAIEHYGELLKRQPDSYDAYQKLAECYMAQEDYSKAKEAYKHAIGLTEEETEKTLLYRKVLEAEEKLVGEEKLGEDGLEALLELARIYLNQDKPDQAKTQLERLKEENPQWRPAEVAQLWAELEKPQTPATEAESSPEQEGS
jgi:peptidyl-prolyl cis-trans isomerase C